MNGKRARRPAGAGAPSGDSVWRRVQRRLFRVFTRGHTWLLVRTDGRPSHLMGRAHFLVLETRGRRSGEQRRVVLLYMADPNGFVVLASNFGTERAPGWWRNLEADPDARVYISGRATDVRAHALRGADRNAVLARAVHYNRQWRRYLHTVRRELPVVLLEPGANSTDEGPEPLAPGL